MAASESLAGAAGALGSDDGAVVDSLQSYVAAVLALLDWAPPQLLPIRDAIRGSRKVKSTVARNSDVAMAQIAGNR